MKQKNAEIATRYRWLVVIIGLVILAISASGARFISFTDDYHVFFGPNNPQALAFDEMQDRYTKDDNILIVLAPKDKNVFTKETMSLITELTSKAWQIPFTSRVDSITNFQHSYSEGDDIIIQSLLLDNEGITAEKLNNMQDIVLNEPLLTNRLISEKGHVTAINVSMMFSLGAPEEVATAVKATRKLVNEMLAKSNNIEIYLTGTTMLNNAFTEGVENDFASLVPIMYGLVLVLLLVSFRSITATLSTLLVMIFSVITTMGITGWLGIVLTPISASAPTIIITLAISGSVHIITMYRQERAKQQEGQLKNEAINNSITKNFRPLLISAITTAIGFLSLNFSEVPPFRDLGNIVAIGIGSAFIYSIFFLPALLSILPTKRIEKKLVMPNLLLAVAELVIKRRNQVLLILGVLATSLAIFSTKNVFNDQFVEYFDDTTQFRKDSDFTIQNLTGVYQINYSLSSSEENGITNPKYLQTVDEFSTWLELQPEVVHVNDIAEIIKRLNKNMNHGRDEFFILPDSADKISQYLLLYELSLPMGLDLNNQIDINKSSTRVIVTLGHLSSVEMLKFEDRVQTWLIENAPAMHTQGASPAIMFAYIGQRNIASMMKGNFSALILISLLLIFALKSFKIGIISLIPNFLPALMAFGLWGILVGQVGLAVSVVAAMSLGIIVDDTVHFLNKYLHAKNTLKKSAEDAIRYTFETVGTALVTTTVTLCLGFLVLTFSAFELNSAMGLLMAITMAFALVTDLLLLPSVLLFWDGKKVVEQVPAKAAINIQ